MDASIASLPPGDIKLTTAIASHVKSQGLFDQIRRDCLADVDTRPAYQNLRQRVDGYVSNFLQTQIWRPDLNKNQLRDKLRRHINGSGMLAIGVDRIVEQVVNPKVNRVFYPQIESTIYKLLEKEPPSNSASAALAMAQQMAAVATSEANNAKQQEASISPPGTTDAEEQTFSSFNEMCRPISAPNEPLLPVTQSVSNHTSSLASVEQTWMNAQDTSGEATTPPEIMSPPPKSTAEIENSETTSSFIREIEEEIKLGQCAKEAQFSSDSEGRSSDSSNKSLAETVKLVPDPGSKPDSKLPEKSEIEDVKDNLTEKQEKSKTTVSKRPVANLEKSKSESTKKNEMKIEGKFKSTEKPVKQESAEMKSRVTEKTVKQESSESKPKCTEKLAKQDSCEVKSKVNEKPVKQESLNKSGKTESDNKKSTSSKLLEHDKSSFDKDKKTTSSQGSKTSKMHDIKGKNSDSNKAKIPDKSKSDHGSTHKKSDSSKLTDSGKTKSNDHKIKSDDSSRDSSKSGLKSPTSKLKQSNSHSSALEKSEPKAKSSSEKHKSELKSDKHKDDAKPKNSEKIKVPGDKIRSDKNLEEGRAKSDKPKVDDGRSKSVDGSKSSHGHEKSTKNVDKGKAKESHKPKDIKDKNKSDSSKDKKVEGGKSSSEQSGRSLEGSKGKAVDKHSSRADTPKRKDSSDKHVSRNDSSKSKGDGDKHGSRVSKPKDPSSDIQNTRVELSIHKDEGDKHSSRSEEPKHKENAEKPGSRVEASKRSEDTEKLVEKSKQKEDKIKTDFVKSKSVEKSSDKVKHESKTKSSDSTKLAKDSSSSKADHVDIKKRKNSDASKLKRDSVDKEGKAKSGNDKSKASEKEREKDKQSKSPAFDKHSDKKKGDKPQLTAKTPDGIKKLPEKTIKDSSNSIKNSSEKREHGPLPSTSKEKLKRKLSMEGISPLKKTKLEPEKDFSIASPVPPEKEHTTLDKIPMLEESSSQAQEKEPVPSDHYVQQIDHPPVEDEGNMSDVTVSSVHTSDLSDYDDRISLTDTEGNGLSSPEKAAKKYISPEKIKPSSTRGRGRPKKSQSPRGRKGRPPSFIKEPIPPPPSLETPLSDKDSPQSSGKDLPNKMVVEGEPRRELRRQRKINPRYTSDEFASIFTKGRDKLHLGDSDEGQQDDERDQRTKSYDDLRPPTRVSEPLKEDQEKTHRGRKPVPAASVEQTTLPDAEIPYSPRSDVSEVDMARSYRRPSKDRDSGGRTLSPKSDVSADSSYSHPQGPRTPESTCSAEGKRRLSSAKHHDLVEVHKPRPTNRGVRRNRPSDHQRYDDSDLYKPRPVITASSRRCRGSSPPLTPELPSNTRRSRVVSGISPEEKTTAAVSSTPHEPELQVERETDPAGHKRKRSISSSGEDSFTGKTKKDSRNVSDNDETASPDRRTLSESSETEPHKLFESPIAKRGRRRSSADQTTSHARGRPPKDRSRRGRR